MAKIKLLRIQTPGASPSTSQVDLGELCVHIADGKIFFKTINGETEEVVALEPNSQVSIGSLNDIDITTVTPTNGQVLVYNSTTEKFEPGNAAGGGASATDLTYTSSTRVIGSSTGNDATLPEVSAGGDSGLMTGADKTKLDGIETGATADRTASEILTELKTVDGATSGLDSDLLDGQEGSYYLNVNNFTGSEVNFDSPNYGSPDDASIKAISGTLALFAGGNERIRIGGNGNVGIGRTSPNEKLDVENNARVRQDLFVDSQIGLGTTSPTYSKLDCRGKVRAVGTSYDQIKVSREHDPSNDTSFIALGTQSANIASLTAGNGSTGNMDLAISTSSSGNTSEQIRITHDSKVGFGTDSPAKDIHLSKDSTPTLRITNSNAGDDAHLDMEMSNDGTFTFRTNPESIDSGGALTGDIKFTMPGQDNVTISGTDGSMTALRGLTVSGEITGSRPACELKIEGSSPLLGFIDDDATSADFYIKNDANRFTILSDSDSDGTLDSTSLMEIRPDVETVKFYGRQIMSGGELFVNNDGKVAGDLTTYGIDISNTSVPTPTPAQIRRASGDYGTIKVTGSSTGGWKGYAIEDGAVFMQNDDGSAFGLYDDTNNHWAVYHAKNAETRLYYNNSNKLQTTNTGVNITGSLTVDGGTCDGEWQVNGRLDVGNGSGNDHEIRIYKADNNVSDHIQFYNNTTRMGEIGCEDTTWLRINQETNKNIYTPRYIRADSGFFVDSTSYGIDGNAKVRSKAGSATDPGLCFGNDTNTGIYRNAADNLGFAAGGVRRGNLTGNTVNFPGIYNTTQAGGTNVRVDSNGRLRRHSSSRNTKTSIEPMGVEYANKILDQVEPVWYRPRIPDLNYPQAYLDSLGDETATIDSCSSYCLDNGIEWEQADLWMNEGVNPNYSYWGFIAEDLAEIDPRLCSQNPETGEYDSVQYEEFTPLLLKIAQEQKAEITSLEGRLAALEQRFNDCSACNL
jgi:hypothetical protein